MGYNWFWKCNYMKLQIFLSRNTPTAKFQMQNNSVMCIENYTAAYWDPTFRKLILFPAWEANHSYWCEPVQITMQIYSYNNLIICYTDVSRNNWSHCVNTIIPNVFNDLVSVLVTMVLCYWGGVPSSRSALWCPGHRALTSETLRFGNSSGGISTRVLKTGWFHSLGRTTSRRIPHGETTTLVINTSHSEVTVKINSVTHGPQLWSCTLIQDL